MTQAQWDRVVMIQAQIDAERDTIASALATPPPYYHKDSYASPKISGDFENV